VRQRREACGLSISEAILARRATDLAARVLQGSMVPSGARTHQESTARDITTFPSLSLRLDYERLTGSAGRGGLDGFHHAGPA